MPGVAPNVQLAALMAFLAACIEHICTLCGYPLPPDIAAGLPTVLAIVVAHAWDLHTGENKPHGDGQ